MEIAHTQAGVIRTIGKIVLLGLLVILLAKVILTLLALAGVGLLIFLCARTLYIRRAILRRILRGTKEAILSATAVFGVMTVVLVTAAGWFILCAFWMVLRLSLRTSCFVGHFLTGLMLVLLALFFYSGRIIGNLAHLSVQGCVTATQAAGAAFVRVRNQSAVICGTFVEAASGALVVAMLLNLKSMHGLMFLPDVERFGARIGAAALFGAFLGITLGLSRITWGKEGEPSHALENQN